MKKQRLHLLILVVVLMALCGGYFGLKYYNKVQSEKPEENDSIIIVDLEAEDVVRLTYDYEGESLSFDKEEDTWYYTPDHTLSIIQYRVKSMVNSVAPLEVTGVIENVTDLTQYGLDEPSMTIQYESEGESHIYYVGDYNSLTSTYYLCAPSSTTVYTVGTSLVTSFQYSLDSLIEEEEETEEATEEEGTDEAAEETSDEVTDETTEATSEDAAE